MTSLKRRRSVDCKSITDSSYEEVRASISRKEDIIYGNIESDELVHHIELKDINHYEHCDHCTKLFIKAARRGSVVTVQKLLLEPDPQAAIRPYEPFFEACWRTSSRSDTDAMKTLLQAAHDGTSQLYSVEVLQRAIQASQHEEVKRQQRAQAFLEQVLRDKVHYFHDAAGRGDVEFVKFLVGIGVDVNADLRQIAEDQSALAIAAAGGHLEVVKYLLSQGSTINPPSCVGLERKHHFSFWDRTPLRAASEGGSLEVVEALLRAGADVNGDGALRAAASNGDLLVAVRLLEAGADVNLGVRFGYGEDQITPLQAAAQEGHAGIVATLLKSNAHASGAALYSASEQGFDAIVQRLIDAGVDVNSEVDKHGTALHGASRMGRVDTVDLLLRFGAKVKPQQEYLPSPLKLAIKAGHLPTAQRLVQAIEADSQKEKVHFVDALHAAVEKGYEIILKSLLETGTPAIEGDDEHTLLVPSAAAKGYTSIVRLLLEAGASMDGTESSNHRWWSLTALQAAIRGGHVETVQCLISAGADVNAARGSTEFPLHMAARHQSAKILQLLLDADADIHAVSYEGVTVRQFAEKAGRTTALRLLNSSVQASLQSQEFDPSLDVSTVVKQNLCTECSRIPLEAFYLLPGELGFERENEPRKGAWFLPQDTKWALWRPSLARLIHSARNGCPFCMFFWKQLGITRILIPPSTEVDFTSASYKPGSRSCRLQERYPQDIERPRQLITSFCIGVEPFTEGPIPVPGSTSSLRTTKQIQVWLHDCLQSHRNCRAHSNGKFLPTRLLDLTLWARAQKLRLVESKQLGEIVAYITLSHRWDARMGASTSTTVENLALRLNFISPDALPLTFLDAVDVTSKLGIEYLWIDTLCILQNSAIDWAHESSLMSQIYQNSYCTISAGATDDSASGLFQSSDVENDSVQFQRTSDDGVSRLVRATKVQPEWQKIYESSPLNTRGWIMQERELSPRILHYTKSQVIWECRELKATQDRPIWDATRKLSSMNKRLLDSITTLDSLGIYDQWHHMVKNYCARHLTKTEDMLPALGGLARIVGEYTKSEYVGGLWAGDLIRSLSWIPDHSYRLEEDEKQSSRHKNYVAPTWSWASLVGRKAFLATGKKNLRVSDPVSLDTHAHADRGILIINEYKVELATSDPYGQIKSASLHISAPVINGVFMLEKPRYNPLCGREIRLKDLSQRFIGTLCFDIPSERGSLQVVRCIPLFVDKPIYASARRTGMGLALVSIEGKQACYRRVGYVVELDYELVMAAPRETLTLL